jgi:hypothetical protein
VVGLRVSAIKFPAYPKEDTFGYSSSVAGFVRFAVAYLMGIDNEHTYVFIAFLSFGDLVSPVAVEVQHHVRRFFFFRFRLFY